MVVARAAAKNKTAPVQAKRQRILDRLNARKRGVSLQTDPTESIEDTVPDVDNTDSVSPKIDPVPESDSESEEDVLRQAPKPADNEGPDEPEDGAVFTVLESAERTSLPNVHRALPYWLQHPTLIDDQRPLVADCQTLPPALRQRLLDNGIDRLFPVQSALLRHLLLSPTSGLSALALTARDVCVSSPTGSGKTLAFVLPLLSALYRGGASRLISGGERCCTGGCRIRPCLRALVVVPTQTLAAQVAAVFRQMACDWSELRVVLLGAEPLARERARIVGQSPRGATLSVADIVVSTPGRLVDHIHHTSGFSLSHLRYLVIDEADRVIEMAETGWLRAVESAALNHAGNLPLPSRAPIGQPLTAASVSAGHLPLQKLLFSATLSQNAEKLASLQLVAPVLFVGDTGKRGEEGALETAQTAGHFVGRYTTPSQLHESYVVTAAELKPLQLLYMLLKPPSSRSLEEGDESGTSPSGARGGGGCERWKRTLVFTNSCRSAHRLCALLAELLPEKCGLTVAEMSSRIPAGARRQALADLASGALSVLVCSDGAARGLDVPAVDAVLCYDIASAARGYIHRVGRTARAGLEGHAVSIVAHEQQRHFQSVLAAAGKSVTRMQQLTAADGVQLAPYEQRYKDALQRLKDVVTAEKREHRSLSGTTKVARCRRKRKAVGVIGRLAKVGKKKRRAAETKTTNAS